MTHKTAEQIVAEDQGYEKFVRAMFNRSGDYSKDFAHAVLGLVTEIYELRNATDPVNAIEEAGDLLFCGVALGQVVGDYELSVGNLTSDEVVAALVEELIARKRTGPVALTLRGMENDLLDHAKRWVGYDRPPKGGLFPVLADAIYVMTMTFRDCGMYTEPDQVELVNVKKLLQRYNGMTFTSEAAVARDLQAERAVLEDATAA